MDIASPAFKENARHALNDAQLQRALGHVQAGFVDRRAQAVAALPEFEALRSSAKAIKDHTLAHLDLYRLSTLAGEDPALLEDYLTPERIAFVEWPGVGEAVIERVAARVRIEHAGGDRRVIEVERA